MVYFGGLTFCPEKPTTHLKIPNSVAADRIARAVLEKYDLRDSLSEALRHLVLDGKLERTLGCYRRDVQCDKEQFADKGRDMLLDGYTEDEFKSVCRELWACGGSSPECYLRTLVDILLGHYMLTRGSDRRSTEISDLFTFEFKGEGPTRCMPLIFTTRASKQN